MSTPLFCLNPIYRLQFETAQDAYVLLYPEGMIQLNGPASEILQLCSEPTSAERIVATLQKKFPEAEELADDVAEFIEQAFAENWLLEQG